MGVQKTKTKVLQNCKFQKYFEICLDFIFQKLDFELKIIAFLERPFYTQRSLHAENFCYDVTNTSALIDLDERGVWV